MDIAGGKRVPKYLEDRSMKILLATDGSEYSKGAARFLRNLKLSADDEITVFHAVYYIPFLYDEESYYGTLKEIRESIAPRIIDSILDILKPLDIRTSVAIADGPPEERIINTAVESGVDLIVMGARGVGGIEAFFIGSITRKVAIKSPAPVLITKLPLNEKPEEFKILFATDGSDYSSDTAKLLSELPFPDTAKIFIVHVMPLDLLDVPETFVPEVVERTTEIADEIRARRLAESERILDQAREYLSKRFRNIEILSESGNPSEKILQTAEALKADLIAAGSRGLTGIKGIMGSVSRNIITHSRCSVLIGKTRSLSDL